MGGRPQTIEDLRMASVYNELDRARPAAFGSNAMTVTVELFGIPRRLAGTARVEVRSGRLGEVLAELAERFPRLAADCFPDGTLGHNTMANLNGQRFVVDPATPLVPGDALLLLSADAGG
jgi:molybdopterin converting factor small subunit